MHYQITSSNPNSKFIELQFTISNIHQDIIHIQLPSWRPGRYELQNFAKNIRCFSIKDEQGNQIPFTKVTKDKWEVQTAGINKLIVQYEYYANQPDAGGSYTSEDVFYINPVNCCMYVEGRMDESYEIEFVLPPSFTIGTQLKHKSKNTYTAPSFDYLADSPVLAGSNLFHHQFDINNKQNTIHFWIQGKHPFDINRLEDDTRSYAEYQTKVMGDMPCKDYHFLYLLFDYPFRHGVEHLDSTVIAMGQTPDNTDEEYYHDLVAISSHELFHLWNIKRIRPAEMLPYNFTGENYSTQGYVYEGITTYLGDLFLLRCGVWDFEQYLFSLANDFKRHFDNPGRFNYSVAESSWDTWLDGYTPGIPARKVSIYMEGLIAALIADVIIIQNTNGKNRLDNVLHSLYQHDAKQNKGYTPQRYQQLLEEVSGISFDRYFNEIINGKGYMQQWLLTILDAMGLEVKVGGNEGDVKIRVVLSEILNDTQRSLLNLWVK